MDHPAISAVRLFGSVARGDADEQSDIDVLVVQRKKIGEAERDRIEAALRILGPQTSVCWYSELALSKMNSDGHLFAWHLFKESFNPFQPCDFVDDLGMPNPYVTGLADIRGFKKIVGGARESLNVCAGNACYEAGLLFVCSRNAAMIASSYLADGPYFDRKSPYKLWERTGIQFPISELEHSGNMKARAIAHRGAMLHRERAHVESMILRCHRWIVDVERFVIAREQDHERKKFKVY